MRPLANPPEQSPRLADRLAAARQGRFVGRTAERDVFRTALLASEPLYAVLHVSGPGGVGKTALLREYARLAVAGNRPVVYLDGRNIDRSPPGFIFALRQAMGLEDGRAAAEPDWSAIDILLIDTYESLAPLDTWLRESFLPQLPARSLVVLAGRNRPETAWRTDPEWADLTRILALGNLQREESQTYLAARGIPEWQHAAVMSFTHGHPLALALVADALSRGDRLARFDPQSEPDVVRVLLERMVREVPSARHREALELCVLAWATTETLLAEVLGGTDAPDLFPWLRQQSFIDQGPHGLFPHDLAREALDADLRWRNPEGRRHLCHGLSNAYYARLTQARGREQQRIWSDVLYLNRYNPAYRPFFAWTSLGTAYAEPATLAEHPAILAMVQRHQGDDAVKIAQHWLHRQPEAFLVFRDLNGEVIGFMTQLALHQLTAEDVMADPAVPAAMRFIEQHGPLRADEEIVYLRFAMDREAYQGPSPAINLTAVNISIYWTTHPKLAWNFIAVADPVFHGPGFIAIHIWRAEEADFTVGGHRYGVFAHDWRVEPVSAWLDVKAELASLTENDPAPAAAVAPSRRVLARDEFADAVRRALRDYTRPDSLAANPLLHSRLFDDGAEPTAAALQTLLREAVDTLAANPKDLKLHRAIWHTYVEPAPTQEQTAELLGLPFNTYRYHLAKGIERITAWLWQRELNGPAE